MKGDMMKDRIGRRKGQVERATTPTASAMILHRKTLNVIDGGNTTHFPRLLAKRIVTDETMDE